MEGARGKGLFRCNVFRHFYFMCSRQKGFLFTVLYEIGKKITMQEVLIVSFIVKWKIYFPFFRADSNLLFMGP